MDRPIGDSDPLQASVELKLGISLRGRHFCAAQLLQIRAVVQDSAHEHRFATAARPGESSIASATSLATST